MLLFGGHRNSTRSRGNVLTTGLAQFTVSAGLRNFSSVVYLIEVGIRLTHQAAIPSMRGWKTILGT